jgi:gliding motility-associated-like protein
MKRLKILILFLFLCTGFQSLFAKTVEVLMWCSNTTNISILHVDHVTVVGVVPLGTQQDTLWYEYPRIQVDSIDETLYVVSTDTLLPMGWYIISVDGVHYTVFNAGCTNLPLCGTKYTKYTPTSLQEEFIIDTDTVNHLRIDIQAFNITDTIQIFFGEKSVCLLGIGGYADIKGPLVWENDSLRSYFGVLQEFPYFDLGVHPEPFYGIGVIIITIPDTVCRVRIKIWSNADQTTVWEAFVHCSSRINRPPLVDTVLMQLCEPQYVNEVWIERDTTLWYVLDNPTGCSLHQVFIITVGETPQIDITFLERSCTDLPMKISIDLMQCCSQIAVELIDRDRGDILFEGFFDPSNTVAFPDYVIPSSKGLHALTLLASIGGCITEMPIDYMRLDCTIYFPTAFSPNWDGINETFFPMTGSEGVLIHTLEIFDRWGNKVFQQHDFPPNSPIHGWDGMFRGNYLDAGVFAWWSRIFFPDGRVGMYSGEITLLK